MKNIVSIGDFIDFVYLIKTRGINKIIGKIFHTSSKRIKNKWNSEIQANSNYWIIPQILERFNEKVSGDIHISFEEYFTQKFLDKTKSYSMLSIGCGAGYHERNFSIYKQIKEITAIDLSRDRINEALKLNTKPEHAKIKYQCAEFNKEAFSKIKFDIIYFNSSLHHFSDVEHFITHDIKPLLNPYGFLVFQEYTGKNRLQYSKEQLELCNIILNTLPDKYKFKTDNKSIKRKVYSPGILRMILNDPSEAPDSESIISTCKKLLETIEIKKFGGDILMPLLKDIAHNFTDSSEETLSILKLIFDYEDKYLLEKEFSDNTFGVFQLI